MSDVFISYAREDRESARRLARALELHGWDVWWDRGLLAGQFFDVAIQEALDAAGCVVVLWSQHSVGSDWVREEADEGKQRGILVPVQIDGTRIPLGFRRIHSENLSDWQGEPGFPGFERLKQAIAQILERREIEEPAIEEPEPDEPAIDEPEAEDPKPDSPEIGDSEIEETALEDLEPAELQSEELEPQSEELEPVERTVEELPTEDVAASEAAARSPAEEHSAAVELTSAPDSEDMAAIRRPSPAWIRRVGLAAVAVVLIVVTIVAVRNGSRAPELEPAETSKAGLAKSAPGFGGRGQDPEIDALASERLELVRLIDQVRRWTLEQRAPVRVLDEVSRALPDLVWIENLHLLRGSLSIDGRAFNTNAVAAFIENLDKVRGFGEPEVKKITPFTAEGQYGYSLQLDLDLEDLNSVEEAGDSPSGSRDGSAMRQASLQEEINRLKLERYKLLRVLPTRRNTEDLSRRLRALVEQADFELLRFTPRSLAEAGEFANLSVSIAAKGTYHSIALFLDRLGRWSRIVWVEELTIAAAGGDSGRQSAKLTLSIPLASSELAKQDATAPETAAMEDAPSAAPSSGPLYDPGSRRNPMRSLVTKTSQGGNERPEGVAGLSIDELEIEGIFELVEGPVAQVQTRKTGTSYLLRKGDQLWDGDVVEITLDRIVFRQTVEDPKAIKPFREVVKVIR